MHNKLQPVAAIAFALALTLGGAAAAQEAKIGIVDVQQAFSSTEEGKKAREELERKAREAQAELKPMLDRARALQEEIETKRFVLSEDALLQKRGELANLDATIRSRREELSSKLQNEQVLLIAPLQKKLRSTIAAVGKERGLAVILDRNADSVMYAREALDITDAVVARFNNGGGDDGGN